MNEYNLLLTKIVIALQNKNYDWVIRECSGLLDFFPNDQSLKAFVARALDGQAVEFFHQNKYDEALDKSRQAYDISPNDRKIIDTYGFILNKQGKDLMKLDQFQEAQKKFDQAIIINSSNKVLYTNKAFVLIKLNNFPEALKSANQALELDPNCLPAIKAKKEAEMGLAIKNKDYDFIIKECNIFLNNHPNDEKVKESKISAMNGQAKQFSYQKKYDDALEICRQACEINPNNKSIIGTYSRILNKQGIELSSLNQFKEVMEKLNQALMINHTEKALFTNKAIIFFKLKNFTEALKFANLALELDPNCLPALATKRDSEIRQAFINKDYDFIIKECNAFLNNHQDDHPDDQRMKVSIACALSWQAIEFFNQEKYNEALNKCQQAHEIDPNNKKIIIANTCILNQQGAELTEENKFDKALEKFNEALRIDPSNEIFYINKAFVLIKLKNFPEALKSANLALELDPNCLPALEAKSDAEKGIALELEESERNFNTSFNDNIIIISNKAPSERPEKKELCDKLYRDQLKDLDQKDGPDYYSDNLTKKIKFDEETFEELLSSFQEDVNVLGVNLEQTASPDNFE